VNRRPPSLDKLLAPALGGGDRPTAFVLAGHNGSGKSTLWYEHLADQLKLPLVNADRLTLSILPEPDRRSRQLPTWAQKLRDEDARWHRLSQDGVRLFKSLITAERMPFAFETVFSYWHRTRDGQWLSKADDIKDLQKAGYFVVLLFVGLTSPELSILRVQTRRRKGGHDVPQAKLVERFPRTQAAVGHAAPLADMTLMFDNSRSTDQAFALVRAQRKRIVLFDARDPRYEIDADLRAVSDPWLDKVTGLFVPARGIRKQRLIP
jgi:predicted ABC-type ATPase